tara:strand:- start:269 stop:1057 length:789 start_codon:yes stop_codon:yes gene_type:complete
MLKKRLIPILYIKNGLIVRSENFNEFKALGNVVNELRRYNEWDIDELFYIDISREKNYDSRRDDHKVQRVKSIKDILKLVSKECFMPLTFGGGIRDFETIDYYLKNGADKVVVNTLIHKDPDIIKKAVQNFGSQAIVAAIDFKQNDGDISFYCSHGLEKLDLTIEEMANVISALGCGELLITSIDKDGSGEGYDLDGYNKIAEFFPKIPKVIAGGAISTFDIEEAAREDLVSGVAAGNMFHFTENIYRITKKSLKSKELNFR